MTLLSQDHQTIARQRIRIDQLEEEVLQLREALAPVILFPKEWNLTRSEERGLAAFCNSKTGFLTNDQVLLAMSLYSNGVGAGGDNLAKVRVFNLRKKTKLFGVDIITRWGRGYEITDQSKALIKAALEQRAAA